MGVEAFSISITQYPKTTNLIRKVQRMAKERWIRSSKERCKGNITGRFEALPTDLNHYVALKHIQPADVYTYFLLIQFDNKELGYAYPSVNKLMELTGSSKATVLASLKRLEQAGLIEKSKSKEFANKNIYFVYKPLPANELMTESVNEVQFEERKKKLQETAKKDKERLYNYLKEKEKKNVCESAKRLCINTKESKVTHFGEVHYQSHGLQQQLQRLQQLQPLQQAEISDKVINLPLQKKTAKPAPQDITLHYDDLTPEELALIKKAEKLLAVSK